MRSETEKKMMKARKRDHAFRDLHGILQRLQFSIVEIDPNVFVIGKKDMCLMVKQMLLEAIQQENQIEVTGSAALAPIEKQEAP